MDEEAEENEPRGYAIQKTVNAVLAVFSVVLFFLTQPLVYRDILDNLGNAASSTFNSFMTNAARFYLGYIKARETEDYLSKTLLSIISARQERSDKATVSVLYALAVELNILQRILVSHFDIPDEVYAELRRKARAEVAVSRKGAQIESVQAQMFGGDTGWQSSSQNGAI